MPQTAAAIATRDLTTIIDLSHHPLVAPVAEAHRALLARHASLNAELVSCRTTILQAETPGGDPLGQPLRVRDARRRAEALADELADLREQLGRSSEDLELARSQARAALRPGLRHDAVQVLSTALEAAEANLAAQTAIEELDRRARRLDIGLALGACSDPFLVHRLKQIRQALGRLQD